MSQLFVIGDDSESYLFDKGTVRVWSLNRELAPTIRRILDDDQRDSFVGDPSVDELVAAWTGQPSHFPDAFAALEHELEPEVDGGGVAGRRVLPNLAINVANDCNLSCTYCYANKGLYEAPRGMLHPPEARAIAARFAREFDLVAGVQFMGGEPSMNVNAMRAVAEEFERAVADGVVAGTPTYRIVTNGLVFTPAFLDLCERYSFQLTVSLDGPKSVHDAARPRVNGSGSYDAVRRNIDLALARGIVIGFEPTFSRAHLRAGLSLIDTCQWFSDEFGVKVLHAPPVSKNRYLEDEGLGLSVEEKVEQYCAVSAWGIDNLLSRGRLLMHDYTLRILVGLSKREVNEYLCPAGNSQISVSTSGEMSPCWMFTDEPTVAMGSVWESSSITDQVQPVLHNLEKFELKHHPVCQACVMQPVCFGCKGGDFHEGSALEAKPNCDYMRAMLATVISSVLKPKTRISASSGDDHLGKSLGERIWLALQPKVAAPVGGGTRPASKGSPVFLPMPTVRV